MISKSKPVSPNGIKSDPVPGRTTIPFERSFLSGGSLGQNVDGSITPVAYIIQPPANEVWYLSNLKIWIEDKGTWLLSTFGAIPVLPNGWNLEFVKDGSSVFEIINFKNNFNLLSALNGTLTLNSGDVSRDHLVLISVSMDPSRPLKLDGAAGDFIRFNVRDNLTGVTNLASGAQFWREI